MQRHEFTFEIDAPPEDVWKVFHGPKPRVMEHGDVRIEILHPGDERGDGLVRHCHFRVPKYLLSGGVARSWEWLTKLDEPRYWRYDAIGKPLWSQATGETWLEPVDSGRRTRLRFVETYEVFNPLMRRLLEARVHRFISKDNDRLMKAGVEAGLAAMRRR